MGFVDWAPTYKAAKNNKAVKSSFFIFGGLKIPYKNNYQLLKE
jgi:hypothetical protein